MCLYPKLLLNKKYQPTKKNKYQPPVLTDGRLKYITGACGRCLECRKQRANGWKVRLNEEQQSSKNGVFVTLTFNEESYRDIESKAKRTDEHGNYIATYAIRHFLERVRKKTGKSLRHWLITERGHEGTERLHIHGLIWHDNARELVQNHWGYGFVFLGQYVNERTINYIVKYVTKPDLDRPDFEGKIHLSGGLGASYINRRNAKRNVFRGEDTEETYRLANGSKIALPTYYRNKLYTDEEREELWKIKLDKGEVYVMGEKCNIDDQETYNKLLEYHRTRAEKMYKYKKLDWDREKYRKRLERQRKYVEKCKQQRNQGAL